MFTQSFGKFACVGDTITCEIDGFTATATIHRDDSGDTPEQHVDDDAFWNSTEGKSVLAAWNNDEWFYCGITVTIERNGVQLTGRYTNALWGIECNYPDSDNSYLRDVANELLDEALSEARAKIADLCMSNQEALAIVLSLAEQGMNHAASTVEEHARWATAIDIMKIWQR